MKSQHQEVEKSMRIIIKRLIVIRTYGIINLIWKKKKKKVSGKVLEKSKKESKIVLFVRISLITWVAHQNLFPKCMGKHMNEW